MERIKTGITLERNFKLHLLSFWKKGCNLQILNDGKMLGIESKHYDENVKTIYFCCVR